MAVTISWSGSCSTTRASSSACRGSIGGVIGTIGSTLTVIPGEGPCFRCLVPELPAPGTVPTCETAGVLGPVPSVIAALQATEAFKLLCGRTAVQVDPAPVNAPDFAVLARRLSSLGEVSFNPHMLRFKIGEKQMALFPDGRAIVKGVTGEGAARSLYARFVGS
jgi:hypothetical protein